MIRITTGDMMHVHGCFPLNVDYTGRVTIRMRDRIDADILARALAKTQKRYPYFLLRLRYNESAYYYDENPLPVVLLNTTGRISLNTPEVNYHLWGVCYHDDYIHLDTFHGMTDGTGMYHILSTLLYYYCEERYGVTDHRGIRTLEDEITPEETVDPQDFLPDIDLSKVTPPRYKEAFVPETDGKLTLSPPTLWDVAIPEAAFIPFISANDASPGTMVSLLLARAIDSLYPDAAKDIIGVYVINARPMLDARETCHNCLGMAFFDYEPRLRAKSINTQCTIYRGKTFLQSDRDIVRQALTVSANSIRDIVRSSPTLSAKKENFAKLFASGEGYVSYLVSYVGKWAHPAIGEYIREFWTHPPNTFSLMAEIAAVNGYFFISIQQRFRENCIREAFLRQLEEYRIPYEVVRVMDSDIPYMHD